MTGRLLIYIVLVLLVSTTGSVAQNDCGIVDSLTYPIDRDQFRLAQDFGVASPRHGGRFHTGEDWYGGRGSSYGTPVRAAANGRVTYTYPLGWGRDGGVVILEHRFPDDTIAYTVYGHMMETDEYQFPGRFACVRAGDVVGVIGDARPAPHLHFEVRVNQPDVPGPGYTVEDPVSLGWRSPEKFVTNVQTWLMSAHRWHWQVDGTNAEAGPYAPPLMLNDNSMIILNGDGTTLRRILPDGRILWRKFLNSPAVSTTGFQGTGLLTFADGAMQSIDADGNFGASWRLDVQPVAPVVEADGLLIFRTQSGEIVAISRDRRSIAWRNDDMTDIQQFHALEDDDGLIIGAVNNQHELIAARAGETAFLRVPLIEPASVAAAPDGLYAFTWGGFWAVDDRGNMALQLDDLPRGGAGSAVLRTDTHFYLFDGEQLHAYSASGELLWVNHVGQVDGTATLTLVDGVLLLLASDGMIAAIGQDGVVCNRTRVYGTGSGNPWHAAGDDGMLRLGIADQVLGLDWATFSRGCV